MFKGHVEKKLIIIKIIIGTHNQLPVYLFETLWHSFKGSNPL